MSNNGQLIETIVSHPNFYKIRARLRANIYHVLSARDPMQTTNVFAKNFSSSEEGQIIIALLKDYLECAQLYNTLEVFLPESGNMNKLLSRDQLKVFMAIDQSPGIPLLFKLLETPKRSGNLSLKLPSLSIPSFKGKPPPEEFTDKFKSNETQDILASESSNEDSYLEEEQLDFHQLLRIPRRGNEPSEFSPYEEEEEFAAPPRKKSL